MNERLVYGVPPKVELDTLPLRRHLYLGFYSHALDDKIGFTKGFAVGASGTAKQLGTDSWRTMIQTKSFQQVQSKE